MERERKRRWKEDKKKENEISRYLVREGWRRTAVVEVPERRVLSIFKRIYVLLASSSRCDRLSYGIVHVAGGTDVSGEPTVSIVCCVSSNRNQFRP
jgi:hypothetical protein